MVTVQMGDEDVVQPAGMYSQPLHRQQHTLAAIDEKRLVADLHQLA